MTEKEFKASPLHIVPIFASLLVSVFCAFLNLQSGASLETVMNFPEAGYGALFTAVLFVLASGFGATLIYFLLKQGVHRLIRFLMATAFSVLTFSLTILYSELIFLILNVSVGVVTTLLLALVAAGVVVWEIFVRNGRLYMGIVLVLGGAAGTLLGASIPTFSAVLILILLAIYDVVAVFHGPIGKIATQGLEHLPGASFSFRDIHVGLGDLTFYSMLVSHVLIKFGWGAGAAAACGVLLGSFLSFKLVERKGIFPGLPFSVMFGLLAGFIVSWGI